jgi:recombination endonuclease VII
MTNTVDLWTPPVGMGSAAVTAWRAFYRKALSGDAGYVVTPAEYRQLYIAQKGRCWICRLAKGIHPDDPKARGSRRLGIDHNHATGQVRGLLCTGGDKTCNRIIGWLNAPALKRAAGYMESPPAKVLEWVKWQEQRANEEGIALSQAELDNLAVSYLWLLDAEDQP